MTHKSLRLATICGQLRVLLRGGMDKPRRTLRYATGHLSGTSLKRVFLLPGVTGFGTGYWISRRSRLVASHLHHFGTLMPVSAGASIPLAWGPDEPASVQTALSVTSGANERRSMTGSVQVASVGIS